MTTHTKDSDCDIDPATDCCRTCGVLHGDPCDECVGRGFHVEGCTDPDARDAAQVLTERIPMRLRFDGSADIVHAASGAVLMTADVVRALDPGERDGVLVYRETPSDRPGLVWCHASIEVGSLTVTAGAPDLVPARVAS